MTPLALFKPANSGAGDTEGGGRKSLCRMERRGLSSHGEAYAVQVPGRRGLAQNLGAHAGSVGFNVAGGKYVQLGCGSTSVDPAEAAATLQSLRTSGQRPMTVLLDSLVPQSPASNSTEVFVRHPLQGSSQESKPCPMRQCSTVTFGTKNQMECDSAVEDCSTPSNGSPASHVVYAPRDYQDYVMGHCCESQQTPAVRKQMLFCGWDGARVGVRSSLSSFRDHMRNVGKCAQQFVDGFITCLNIGDTTYVESCLARSWQLKPPQAHPQVELKVASTGLFVLAEGWNGDWDRINKATVLLARNIHGDSILSEVRLEGCSSEVVYALTADPASQVQNKKVFDLETKEADLHHVLSQISQVICFILDAFDAEVKVGVNHKYSSVYKPTTPQVSTSFYQTPPILDDGSDGDHVQKHDCFYHTHFTKAYDREKLIQYLKDFDESEALSSYPAEMPLFMVPNAGNMKVPGHVVLRGKPEGVRGPKTGTARWGSDGKNGFLIVGAEANAKQNKQLEERYEKGIYPVAIFLITNPASFELDDRFSSLPDEVWTDGDWEIHEQPLHSNSTELVGPNGCSYQPPAGWRWIEIRQKKDESKRYKHHSQGLKRPRGTPSRIVLMNMRKVVIDFKQEVKNGVLDLGTKRGTSSTSEETTGS